VANPSNQQAIATQFSNGPGSVEQTSWTQPQGLTTFPGDSNEPFSDIQGLLFKFAIATTVVLIACVVSLQVASIVSKSRRQPSSELEVCDSIAISRESGVKLIRIGTERIVVGHDRQGLRSMVLLPARFDQLLAKEQAEGDPNGAIEIAGDLRMALANPEDKGWDLNRLKS
jgi:flagellar biogenesis protein FliO